MFKDFKSDKFVWLKYDFKIEKIISIKHEACPHDGSDALGQGYFMMLFLKEDASEAKQSKAELRKCLWAAAYVICHCLPASVHNYQPTFISRHFMSKYLYTSKHNLIYILYYGTLGCWVHYEYTANVFSAEYTDVCLRSKFKNKHQWFLHVFDCNWLQLFSCCFYISSKAQSSGK